MDATRNELLIWGGGAVVVVLAVLGWLWFDQPPENLLPQQYRFGIL